MTLLNKEQIKAIYSGKIKPHPGFHIPLGFNKETWESSMRACNNVIKNFTPVAVINKVEIQEALKKAEKEKKK